MNARITATASAAGAVNGAVNGTGNGAGNGTGNGAGNGAGTQKSRPGRPRSLVSAAALLASAGASACSSPPPPQPQVAVTPPPVVHVAEAPPLPPARWVDSSGATLKGPTLAGGTLVLLGGRRALVAKDGSTKVETAPAPEGLLGIIEVPNARGERRLIGHGPHTIYRFDDPLGAPVALARSDVLIDHIGAGPGLVAVWDFQSFAPRFIDVETGQPKTLPNLPLLPIRAVAFKNANEGAGAFEGAGLAITTDGGASWRLAADTSQGRDALRITGLRLAGDAVRAFVYANGPDAPIDLGQARLSALIEPAEPSDEFPLLRWIRVTERDPLDAAAAAGVEAPGGGALIASHGLVARVDTKSGALLDLNEFSKGYGLGACEVARAGGAAWLGCILSEDGDGGGLVDPFALLRVPLSGSKLAPEPPAIRVSAEVAVRSSPSGGVMLFGPCSPNDDGNVCVRQPSGSWTTIHIPHDLVQHGAGPLADGRVALVRGLEEGDVPEGEGEMAAGAPPGRGEGEPGHSGASPMIVTFDKNGTERRLATLSFDGGSDARLAAISPIEEDEDHTLRFVLSDGDGGVFSVVQPAGREGVAPQRLPRVTHARIHAGRGVAVGGDAKVIASSDGGSTWSDLALPERTRRALADTDAGYFDEPGTLMVSEVGAKLDTQLRIGWGPSEPPPEPKVPDPAASLGARPLPPLGPEKVLTCSSAQGAGQGSPPLTGASEITNLFYKGKPPKSEKGRRVSLSVAPSGRAGMLDTIAVLEEQGSDKQGELPKTWSIRWMDPAEVGAKPRSWSGPAPKGTPWGTSLRLAATSGGRALFSLRAGGKYILLRVKPAGGVEVAEVDYERLPSGDVMFGTDAGEPIVWSHDTSVVAWRSGEEPRIIANLGGRGSRSIGQPTKDGVPVLLSFNDMALVSTLPIPALAKAAKAAKGPKPAKPAPDAKVSPSPPLPISLDTWATVPNVVRREASRLPVCAGKGPAKSSRFVFSARQLSLRVDGATPGAPDALYDVRVAPGEACVAGVSALFLATRRPTIPPPTLSGSVKPAPAKPTPAPPVPTKSATSKPTPAKPATAPPPATFVRVDFAGKRADGGERGLSGTVRKMTCAL